MGILEIGPMGRVYLNPGTPFTGSSSPGLQPGKETTDYSHPNHAKTTLIATAFQWPVTLGFSATLKKSEKRLDINPNRL